MQAYNDTGSYHAVLHSYFSFFKIFYLLAYGHSVLFATAE